jgi:hypothetical protein
MDIFNLGWKLIVIHRKTGKTSRILPAWDCCFGAARGGA